ncbi:MAG: TetR/AcrR family transcriptional regulator [Treponema sp.]|jgi:AcrR family transcriptional regulator|nr:TetR/AcrR family transcriptional regulator [Treponema sp.]
MAIVVEHDKRRKKILEKALVVFMDDGFENATFQKIADKCGITRTILYLYFKNKREIFIYSIKQLLLNLEENIKLIIADKSLRSTDKITKVLFTIFKVFEQNRQFICVVHDYLLHLSKGDGDPEARVRRRTVKFRHILSTIVIEGVKAGDLKKINVKTVHNFFYSFVEAAIFQLVVYKRNNLADLKETAAFAIKQLAA